MVAVPHSAHMELPTRYAHVGHARARGTVITLSLGWQRCSESRRSAEGEGRGEGAVITCSTQSTPSPPTPLPRVLGCELLDPRQREGEGSWLPHSVHTAESPTGYAQAGHRPRLMRLRPRSANGAAKSSHRIAA
jgi:hypothetical protein